MSFNLDEGAIMGMLNNDTSIQPRLQVLDVKKIVTGSSGERYRLVLSDGVHYVQGMLASQCSGLLSGPNKLERWTVIHLKEFVCNHISGKKICVVINCDIIGQCQSGIGSPQNAQNATNTNAQNPPAQQRNSGNSGNQQRGQYQAPAPPSNQQAFHQRNHSNFNRRPNNGSKSSSDDSQIQPVSSLNPYQNQWTIKVRVTNKDNMRHYHNQKGDGKLFGIDLLDKDGTEIRAVMFNDAADKFFPIFEKNKVYTISRGQVRLARQGFSHIKNDYSITLNGDAEISLVNDEESQISAMKYAFKNIQSIEQLEAKTFVDVIGVVVDIGPISQITSNRTQKQLTKRSVKIADKTAKIEVTLWNEHAEQYDEVKLGNNPVVAFKGAKVSHFGGRSLSASGVIEINPAHTSKTDELRNWFKQNGGNVQVSDMTQGMSGGGAIATNAPRITFAEVKAMKIGEEVSFSENKDKKNENYFNVVATITAIAQSPDKRPWYQAVPDLNATDGSKNSKVVPDGNGQFLCEKNGKRYNSYLPRYILRFCATDFSGNVWMTAFNEVAEQILGGVTAVDAEKHINEGRLKEYEEVFKKAQFSKYVIRCRASPDTWEDQVRVRYTAVKAQLADPSQEAENILSKINVLNQMSN